jgi:hypothetical protein
MKKGSFVLTAEQLAAAAIHYGARRAQNLFRSN